MMRISSKRTFVGLFFLFVCPFSVLAQTAATNGNVILRRDPWKGSVALAHLPQGARLTLVDATPDNGFYHVRTEDEQVGWVSSKFVIVSPSPTPPTPTPPTSPTPETPCDASLWNHVYHPLRLIVKQPCITVAGTIVDATPTSTVFRAGSFVFYDLGFFSSLPALTCHVLRGCITWAGMPSVA